MIVISNKNGIGNCQMETEERQGQRCMLELCRYCQTLGLSCKRD